MIKKFLFFVLAGMGALAGLVFLVDPFYHFHKPWFGMEPYLYNAVYQTSGAARNLEYDSVIVGTSMTENFRTSWFDEMGLNTIKLSYSGARTDDLNVILESVFSSENQVKQVFMDINDFQLTVLPFTAYVERPQYLYDGKRSTDIYYIMNKDVLLASIGRLLGNMEEEKGNLDKAYVWEDAELFGKEIVLDQLREEKRKDWENMEIEQGDSFVWEDVLLLCQGNLDNILGHIEAHPDTDFYIFYPPYSVLYWERLVLTGRLEDMIEVYSYSIERLLEVENVKLFYFQDEFDLIVNLDYYRDECHHVPEINRYIFECMRDNTKRITKDNYMEHIQDMYYFAKTYDYESIWEEYEE